MKNVLCIILVCALLFALAACGGQKEPTPALTEKPQEAPAEQPAVTQAPAEAPNEAVEYPTLKLIMSAQGSETGDINITSRMFIDKITEYTNGSITFEEYWNGALCAGTDQLKTIGSQISDCGDVVTLYYASDLPLSQIAYCIPFFSPEPEFVGELQNRFAELHPELKAEFENSGVHMMFYKGIGDYNLMWKGDMTELKYSDLKGSKVCLGGIYYTPWFEAAGATTVGASKVTDSYTNFQNNIIDASFMNLSGQCDYKLYEVSDIFWEISIGARACHAFCISQVTWDSLDANTQALFEKVAAEVQAEYYGWCAEVLEKSYGILEDDNTVLIKMSDEEKAEWAEDIFAYKDTLKMWIDDITTRGYDGAQLMSDYLSLAEEMGYTFVFDTAPYKVG